ncbi:endonuclease/exonuclease/phosphatase family protein [Actinokineospora globicatena]|uniref:endonuclease/exonuclease/phosphatase family protein n=1 Tax=Actinokineospora globicatena TaxID=103729 RepID=UPI0020A53476|nr:endonuclease/exonuclease/phosphatase family protein [Actinokineospora globicatena]MCP2300904.1 Metal-dependent hydrolase, endonuclease/exonuclease/phosphatase family [Actinokineospora globicatena]GLW77470.1 endonuclease [Actinokineospora globicatena]GLW84304.1 endonuclease [Actinokineospora globicatena]
MTAHQTEDVAVPTDEDHAPPRRRRRRGVTFFLALLVAPLIAIAVMRLGGIDGNNLTAITLALTPYVAGYGAVLTLLALALRRKVITALALVLTLSLGVLLLPRLLPDGDPVPQGQRVRMMTANLMIGRADPEVLVSLVRDAKVDVLTLQELTPAALASLDAEGLGDLLPYRAVQPVPGGEGGGILSRIPLRQISLVENTTFENVAAVVDLSGPLDIEVVTIHIVPPTTNDTARKTWQRELGQLPAPDAKGRPRILSGDFNATLDHHAFTGLLDRGYDDAAELTGEGMRPTWSSKSPPSPPVTIDHIVMDRRLHATSVAVYDLPGSDHNAVFAELALPR